MPENPRLFDQVGAPSTGSATETQVTLHDLIAGMAMQGIINAYMRDFIGGENWHTCDVGHDAVRIAKIGGDIADAWLAERERREG